MVHNEDKGSEFDAPIDVIWKYFDSPDGHIGVHKGFRNVEAINLSVTSDIITFEQKFGDRWVKNTGRVTEFSPLGMVIETLTGPMAGSKQVVYYTPKGDKTAISVIGEFVSNDVEEAQLVAMIEATLQEIFEEDVEGLKRFRSKTEKTTP